MSLALPNDSRCVAVFSRLRLFASQEREALDAWNENPDGCEREAYESMSASNPASAFIARIRAGRHREAKEDPVRYTGWRFVRGSHGGTYKRDPKGRDVLPQGYDLTPAREPQRYSDSAPDDLTVVERDENKRRVRELQQSIGRNL